MCIWLDNTTKYWNSKNQSLKISTHSDDLASSTQEYIVTFSPESYSKTKVCTFEYKTFVLLLPGSEVQVHLSI